MSFRLVLKVLVVFIGISTFSHAAEDSRVPSPVINQGKGDKCVEPTDEMRRNHMDYILHQRDETMYKGVRTEKHSLKECRNCHASKGEDTAYLPVNAPGQFCQSCHSYASVKIDCFECHATRPQKDISFHPIVTPRMDAFKDVHEDPKGTKLLNSLVKMKKVSGGTQ